SPHLELPQSRHVGQPSRRTRSPSQPCSVHLPTTAPFDADDLVADVSPCWSPYALTGSFAASTGSGSNSSTVIDSMNFTEFGLTSPFSSRKPYLKRLCWISHAIAATSESWFIGMGLPIGLDLIPQRTRPRSHLTLRASIRPLATL